MQRGSPVIQHDIIVRITVAVDAGIEEGRLCNVDRWAQLESRVHERSQGQYAQSHQRGRALRLEISLPE